MTVKAVVSYLVMNLMAFLIAVPISIGMLYLRLKNGTNCFKIKTRAHPPPILEDPKHGTHRYILLQNQGIKLHYVEKGDKNNPLILCLHGFPDCWYSWKSVLDKFSDKYWVVALDLRGYGGSDKPEGLDKYTTDILVEDIRELLLILSTGKCVLMAHDWGGVLGWLVTCKYPELFYKHISLNGPHISAMNDHRSSSWSQFKKSWYVYFFQNSKLPEMMLSHGDLKFIDDMFEKSIKISKNKLNKDEIELYKYYFSQEYGLTAPLNYYRNVNFGKKLPIPICKVDSLIVWGVDDTALDKEIAEKTAKYCEKLQIHYIENCGHFVLQENPEAVHEPVRNFLENKE